MKTIITFIAGIITGAILMIGGGYVLSNSSSVENNNTIYFDTPGECVSSYKFKVFQALEPGYALATEIEKGKYSGNDYASGVTVLFYDPQKRPFYDEQIIKIPKGYCAKQIGTHKYMTNGGTSKTVPIVQILSNK